MAVSQELVRLIAREALGRDVEAAVIEETARRLEGLLSRVRGLDLEQLLPLEPPAAFNPGHPAWARRPEAGEPAWAGLGAGAAGSSGYGTVPAAGGPSGAGAPPTVGTPPAAASAAAGAPSRPGPATGPRADLWFKSLAEVAEAIRRRQVSPVEVTRAALDRLEAVEGRLNAFITVTAGAAMEAARAAEAALVRREPAGPLHGVPVALKDLFETAGVPTTAGSRILADHVPSRDGTVVRRLREAGAILVGKTNTHEFAFGPTTINPHYGPTRNPWALDRVPGGSSGGSAAAVAAGVVYAAMGTDTGGSIRIPAAACGTVGLKPTYGLVSRHGIIPLSWSLDHAGPLTRTVADAALVLGVIAGRDPSDHATVDRPVPEYAAFARPGDLKGVRVGVARAWAEDRVAPAVGQAFEAAVRALSGIGAEVREVQLPAADHMMVVNRLIALAEAAAYHAPYLATRARDYGADVRGRLELGQYLLARDYLAGQRLRGEMCRHLAAVMDAVDVVAVPTVPVAAPRIDQTVVEWGGEVETVPEALIRLTAPFNVTGNPVLALPCGFTPDGLPVSLQLAGRPFDEATLLRVGATYEATAGWFTRRPPI